jgi:6-phosphofructokinase
MSSGKILVAQGGGPTAVINQSLVGVVLEARRFRESRACTVHGMVCAASSTKTSST